MAINYDRENNDYSHIGVPFNYTRGNPIPLDNSQVWTSYLSAAEYAKNSPVAYVGQLITVSSDSTFDVYVIENSAGNLKKLATNGTAEDLKQQLCSEISTRIESDSIFSSQINTLSTETIPTLSSTLNSNLSVTVEKQLSAESGFDATYVVKQGGVQVGEKINIPKDKVIEKAEVVKFATDEEAQKATGDPTAKAGTYLKLTIQNQTKALYVPVPGLASVYEGFTGPIVKTSVNQKSGETYSISADILDGTIPESKLCSEFTTKVANVIAAQAEDRAYIDILSGDDTTEGSVKKALKDAKDYTNTVSSALSADYVGKIDAKGTELVGTINSVSTFLSGDYTKKIGDEETARTTAIGELSVELKGDISTARDNLSAYARETSANALAEAKTYTDGKDTSVRTDLSAYARETSANALVEAKAYTDSEIKDLSVELKGDISQEVTDRNTAIEAKGTVLSAYVVEKSDEVRTSAVAIAKEYTDTEIAKLSVSDVYETKADATAKLKEAKEYTDALSVAVDTKIGNVRTDLSTYARETSANALAEAKTYADGIVSTEETRAKDIEQTLSTNLGTLSTTFGEVSANHETRIAANEAAIDLLSSAMHFRGALQESEISSGETVEQALVRKFKPCAKGDLAIYVKDGTEFVYVSDLSAEAAGWVKLGDEGTYVTKTTFNAKVAELEASDSTLSGMIKTEKERAEGIEGTLRTDLDTLSTNYNAKVEALDAMDSVLCTLIGDEETRAKGIEAILSGDLSSLSSKYETSTSELNTKIGEVSAFALSGVTLNGVDFAISANVAELTISCINCGDADTE